MSSLAHELFLTLFRNRPELAAELLREALGLELPRYTEVRLDSVELVTGGPHRVHPADLVDVLLIDSQPVLGIVVEVQLSATIANGASCLEPLLVHSAASLASSPASKVRPCSRQLLPALRAAQPFLPTAPPSVPPPPVLRRLEQRLSWPVYVANLRARIGCSVELLVIAPDDAVARWAAPPIRLGRQSTVTPLVVGSSGVPVVVDPARAIAAPGARSRCSR